MGPVLDIRRTPEAVRRALGLGGMLALAPPDVLADEVGTVLRAMNSHPEDSRAGGPAPAAGPGPDVTPGFPPVPVTVPGAASSPRGGTRGTPMRAGGGCHPLPPLAPEPVPGRFPPAGTEGGNAEPSSPAPSRAGLGAMPPGPARTSPPAAQGRAGGAAAPVPGGGPGLPGTGTGPAGGGPHDAPPAGTTPAGQEFRRAWQAARSAQAKAVRTSRGRHRARRPGDAYGPGSARRLPPGDGL